MTSGGTAEAHALVFALCASTPCSAVNVQLAQ